MLLFALLQATAPLPPTPAMPAAPPAPWTLATRTNPDGSVLSAAAGVRSADGTARLVLRCDRAAEPVVSLQFRRVGQPLAAAADHVVSLAADGAKPIDAPWQFGGVAAVMSEPEAVTELTVAMASARTLRLTTTDAGAPVVASFDGPVGKPAVRAVLEACGYALGTVPEPIKPVAK